MRVPLWRSGSSGTTRATATTCAAPAGASSPSLLTDGTRRLIPPARRVALGRAPGVSCYDTQRRWHRVSTARQVGSEDTGYGIPAAGRSSRPCWPSWARRSRSPLSRDRPRRPRRARRRPRRWIAHPVARHSVSSAGTAGPWGNAGSTSTHDRRRGCAWTAATASRWGAAPTRNAIPSRSARRWAISPRAVFPARDTPSSWRRRLCCPMAPATLPTARVACRPATQSHRPRCPARRRSGVRRRPAPPPASRRRTGGRSHPR